MPSTRIGGSCLSTCEINSGHGSLPEYWSFIAVPGAWMCGSQRCHNAPREVSILYLLILLSFFWTPGVLSRDEFIAIHKPLAEMRLEEDRGFFLWPVMSAPGRKK